jgi:hypothetical protein
VKPVLVILWILSIALAVGLTRLAGPDRADSELGASPSFEEAFGERDTVRRAYLISRSLQDLGSDNLPELLTALLEQRSDPGEVRLAMHAWARFDAPGAYAWASEEAPAGARPKLTDQAIHAWASYDGAAAMRVVEAIEEPELKGRLRTKAMDAWMRGDDRQGVTQFIADYPEAKRRARFMMLLSGEAVKADGLDAAMRWVESIPDDAPREMKLALFHNVAKLVAAAEPIVAAEWFLEHRTRSYSEGALAFIARRWVQRHPDDRPAAFEWLLAMSSDGIREGERGAAISAGFRSWMQIDPDAAQLWLASALPNPALEPAVTEAYKRLLGTDPGAAMVWVQRLEDDAQRHKQSVRVGVRWRGEDRVAFDAWMKQSDLPEETRQEILAAPIPAQRATKGKPNSQPRKKRKAAAPGRP